MCLDYSSGTMLPNSFLMSSVVHERTSHVALLSDTNRDKYE